MNNEELSKAIQQAHMMVRGTSDTEALHDRWTRHLDLLLVEQAKRAQEAEHGKR